MATNLQSALDYAARGWRVFPLHSMRDGRCTCGRLDCDRKAKHPRTKNGLKDATADEVVIRGWWESWPEASIGIATGADSGLVVLDVDPRHGGDRSLEALGRLPDTIEALTGGGGRHLYFAHPGKPVANSVSKLGAGLDVRGDGGYVVAPPSTHESGKRYEWEASSEPGMVELAPMPACMVSAAKTPSERATVADESPFPSGTRNHSLARIAGAMRRQGAPQEAIESALAATNLARCVPPLDEDEVRSIARSVARYKPAPAAEEPPPPSDSDAPPVIDISTGEVITGAVPLLKSYANLCRILREPGLRKLLFGDKPLELNTMIYTPTIGRRPVEDVDYGRIRERIETKFRDQKGNGLRFQTQDIAQAVHQIAAERPFHPVREYLEKLQWDGTPRIEHLLEDVLDAPKSELSLALLRKWFISAVARAMRPGCKVDSVLIFIGGQGVGKSTFFATLAGEWFSDTAFDVGSKDAYLVLSRSWIVEWAELEAMQRARDAGAVKSFLTSRADSFRPPYGREVISVPRSCVIVGTTNEQDFLIDSTGNRRYWPIKAGPRISITTLAKWRDQLWAEARVLYESGEEWYLDQAMEAKLAERHKEHEARDAWEFLVLSYAKAHEADSDPLTTARVLEYAIQKDTDHWTKADQSRVAAILTRGGYRSVRKAIGGVRYYEWVKNDPGESGVLPVLPVPPGCPSAKDGQNIVQ